MKKFAIILLAIGIFSTLQTQAQENTYLKVGEKAPDIELADTSGEKMKLSEIGKKSIVLVDFWASWCGPCRRANPELVAMYEEYSDKKFQGAKKGFKIVSISLDAKADKWKYAIEKDGLVWPYHLSDLKAWRSKAVNTFGVQFVPQCFLMDENGIIIGKYLFASQAKAEIEKRLKE